MKLRYLNFVSNDYDILFYTKKDKIYSYFLYRKKPSIEFYEFNISQPPNWYWINEVKALNEKETIKLILEKIWRK